MKKRLFSIVLTLAMILSLFASSGITVSATDSEASDKTVLDDSNIVGTAAPKGGTTPNTVDSFEVDINWSNMVSLEDCYEADAFRLPATAFSFEPVDAFANSAGYWMYKQDDEWVPITSRDVYNAANLTDDTQIYLMVMAVLDDSYMFADTPNVTCDDGELTASNFREGIVAELGFALGTKAEVDALIPPADDDDEGGIDLDANAEAWWGFGEPGSENFSNYTVAGDLTAAFTAANENADATNTVTYVKLNKQISVTTNNSYAYTLDSDKVMVLDLNDKTITANSYVIQVKGNLTVENGGIIAAPAYNSSTAISLPLGGTFTATDCDIQSTATSTAYGIYAQDSAIINVTNCTIEANATSESASCSGTGIYTSSKAEVTISNCEILRLHSLQWYSW